MTAKSRRWRWLLLLLPFAVVIAGFARLRFDVDVLNLLPADVPAVQGLKLHQKHFANARELIITLRATDAETAETAARSLAESLRAQTSLIRAVHWQPPWMEQPAQSAELIAYLWLNQPPDLFSQLTNRVIGTNALATLTATRQKLATTFSPADLARLPHDPFDLMRLPDDTGAGRSSFGQGQEFFASADGAFRLIFVQAASELANYRQCAVWLDSLKSIVDSWKESNPALGKLPIHFTGAPAFTAEIASGMERDMTSSVLSTLGIIAALFWLAHRRWRPLLWLVSLVTLILAGTLALGGLVVGTLNVVSTGFAAILLGLAVDYGLVLYQEWLAAPRASVGELRRALAPSIGWSAATTAGAFLVLNFSGLPGLAQLGTLVALGITLAALVMLYAYLPPLVRKEKAEGRRMKDESRIDAPRRMPSAYFFLLPSAFCLLLLWRGPPALDHTSTPLRPRHSPAYDALDELKREMGGEREPYWLLVPGANETEVARRLATIQPLLERAVSNRQIARWDLPLALWPNPAHQAANRSTAQLLAGQRRFLHDVAFTNGFNSFAMTDAIFDSWQRASASASLFWPSNAASRWLMEKVIARSSDQSLALGMIYPPASATSEDTAWEASLTKELRAAGAWLGSWDALGRALLEVVKKDLWLVVMPTVALLGISLWLAFRRLTEMVLSLGALALSGLCLLTVMKVFGWTWNLLNLMALPVLLGTGVDYSIHVQSALRRHRGDIALVRRSTGRALWLCGGTTIAGFGSLVWSSNAGLASLGQVCAVGIGCSLLVAVYLLPIWWQRCGGVATDGAREPLSSAAAPSGFYRAGFWRAGLLAGRFLPSGLCSTLTRLLVSSYGALASKRREVLVQNLLPVFQGDRTAAEQASSRLFQNFAVKLVDLWRYESGRRIDQLFAELTGWEHFLAAQARDKGVLLITPHLGNWEFGGPLLTRRGVKLHVITLAEPGRGFTEMRQASRTRWSIETLVIGQDAFAFVEVIKRLQSGATVALLVDRPPAASAVTVELFGRPFRASVAAAELARASGAALVPVCLPRTEHGYAAHILPEIAYDRAALGNREARCELTQKIMRAFEPAIRQHPDQWYHFVPIWPEK
jgi:predicted exporter/lauroyl/myristoyl acyltransferase